MKHMTSDVNMDSSAWVISLLWFLISLSSFVLSDAEPCIQTNTCSCHTSNLNVNLAPLSSPAPRFTVTEVKYSYAYNPCTSTGQPCGGSQTANIAICQTDKTSGSTYIVGLQSNAVFSGSPDDGSLRISYHSDADTSGQERIGHVDVVCVSDEVGQLVYLGTTNIPDKKSTTYRFQLNTKYACLLSTGLSPGSVLLIIFFVLLFVYLVAGVLFLRYIRGARGVEMIPNIEMWKALPLLVKDGCVFVGSKCKKDATYSNI